ncbi:MAG: VWA domain-containing protein [Vicinamibacterales bacterium]
MKALVAARAIAAVGVVVWAAGATPLPGRQQSPPQFRARTDLVQVDVVVLDADGRPVRGLQASDFTILDRRRPQPIQTFTEISHAEPDSAAGPRPPADVRLDVADNTTAKSQRAIVLVIQNMNLRESRVAQVKEVAARVVRDLGPSASMALLFTSGHGSVELTEDRATLLDAVDGFGNVGALGLEAFLRLLKSVQDAARHLQGDNTRRKAIIVIAPGMGANITGLYQVMRPRPTGNPIYDKSGTQERSDIAFLTMMDALRRSNVTLYGVDPRTPVQNLEERAHEGRDQPALRMFDEHERRKDSLELSAEASGGFAVMGSRGLDAGLNRIVADLDNYYLLGFYAEDPDSDKWRDLEVTVNRPGVIVRHRKGYRGGAKPPKPKNKDPMVQLSEGVLPQTDLRLRLFATSVSLSPKLAKVAVSLEARDPALTAAGSTGDRVTATILAVDLKRRKVVKRVDRRADVALGADEAYQFPFTMDLPPGRYQLRASAASAASGKSGSVYLMLDVPAQPREGIAIAGASLSPSGDGEAVLHDRAFGPGDVLHVSYWIARADRAAAVASTVEILDSGGAVVFNAAPHVPDGATARVRADVALKSLPPGSYRLRIIARSGVSEAAREIGFAIR